jgi:hypothetical protein
MLIKQGIDVSFAEGLDTKTDKKRVKIGKFVSLENTVFTKGGLLQKRNGYQALPSLPDTSYSYLTTFNGNLTAVGTKIAALNNANQTWVTRGTIQPLQLSTLPLLRNNLNQTACDAVVAPNGLVCTVYLESNGTMTTNKYVIADSVTGQNIVAPAVIPVASGTVSGGMRVFVLGQNFILAFTNTISGTAHLQYVAISINNTSNVGTNTDLAPAYQPEPNLSWDGFVFQDWLYVAYNSTSGSQSVKVTKLNKSLGAVSTPTSFATFLATSISVTVDGTNPATPFIYITWWNGSDNVLRIAVVDQNLLTIQAAHTITTVTNLQTITSAAQNGQCSIFLEDGLAYDYDNTIVTNFIAYFLFTLATSSSVGIISIRSAGLASKAFIIDGIVYYLAAYQSAYQSTYFLINGTASLDSAPVIVAKLAYENGGGYLPTGLPGVTVTGSTAQIAYLFKDLIEAVNKDTNVPAGTQVNGIYSQTGINLSTFILGTTGLDTAEIGNDLHLSGGFLWMYDGYLPVEHNFFLWPDYVEVTASADPTPTGTISNTVTPTIITSLSSVAGIVPGMNITGTAIPANTTVVSVGTTTVTMSAGATAAHSGETITFTGNVTAQQYYYQVTYEWSDNQGNQFRSAPSIPATATASAGFSSIVVNVPTLRLTYKTANPVKIVIYRWSVGQPEYYQTTSITAPIMNDTTIDQIAFTDINSDDTILGNNLIYTTGGVIEDVNAPATNIMALFDTRLWLVDAEDQNLLWFSKQVIEATPVEMSDLLTIYVPPTVGTEVSTGPIRTLFPMDDKLIIGKRGALVYINGAGPDNTGANDQYSQPTFITSTVGCDNQQSFVLIPQGLMFQSDKGIWLLDRGLGTSYIGAAVEEFTTGATVLSAVNIPDSNQVRFTLSSGVTLMYDYYYEQWGTFYNVPGVSSTIFENQHTFINSSGAAYQEAPNTYIDGAVPTLIQFTTGPLRLGDLQNYQRAYFFYLLGTYISPHKLAISITYDYENAPSQTVVITPNNYSTPYGAGASQSPYGQGNPYGGPGSLETWRVFFERQRCMALSISVQEIFDATLGAAAGAGLTLSGINFICGFKKAFRPQSAATSTG